MRSYSIYRKHGRLFAIFLPILLVLFLSPDVGVAQTMMPLPPHSSNYSGMVRGYWFVSPTSFTVTGLRVPTNVGTANQSIQIVRFTNGPPPAYSQTTTSFVTLGYWYNVPGVNQIACNIPVQTGDVIGIYGYRGTTNSYSQSPGPYSSTIDGLPVTLTRTGYQGNINTGTPAPNFWTESGGPISRVEMWYTVVTAPNDAGIADVTSPLDFCPGTYDVKVILKNYGTLQLTSADINWTLNGAPQPTYNWSGLLDTLSQTTRETEVTLGSQSFLSGVPYTIRAWTMNPNGIPDTINANDTTEVTRQAAISGTFTIGGTSPDFTNFSTAVAAINANGVCGPVVFNVRSGTYTQQIAIGAVNGTSSTNTITFQSESGVRTDVILKYGASSSANPHTLKLDGADFIRFRNMTIKTTGSSYARAVVIEGGSDYNTFENCVLQSKSVSSTSNYYACVYGTSGSADNYNEFRDCLLQNGAYGFYWYGASTSSLDEGTIFENNTVKNFYYMGMYMYYQDAPQVTGNVIQTNSTYTNYGIYMYYNYNNRLLDRNQFIFTGTGNKYGMMLYYQYGSSSRPGQISNNFVTVRAPQSGYYPMYLYYGQDQNVYNNTYYNGTTSSSYYGARIYYGSNIKLKNNIFYHAGPGYSIYVYPGSNVTESDYNLYYTSGNNLAYWGGTRSNLAALRAASGGDQNSINKPVTFENPTMGDLHLAGASQDDPDLTGTPLSEITIDIDGDPRARPYIGADEGCYILPGQVMFEITDVSGTPIPYFNYPGSVYVKYNIGFPAAAFTATVTLNFYTVPTQNLAYTTSFTIAKQSGIPANGIEAVQIPSIPSGYYRVEALFETYNSCEQYTSYNPGDIGILGLGTGQTPCLVWPGDVNNDGVVSYGDRSALNKYIQMANLNPVWLNGPARFRADYATNPLTYLTWEAQAAAPWQTPDGCYMDADGNGMVNSFDYIGIRLNWLKDHGAYPKPSTDLQPGTFDMSQNYPNPFGRTSASSSTSTSIRYSVPEHSTVRLTVVDMLGRTIATLVDGRKDRGVHTITYDGTGLNPGRYLATVVMTGESGLSFSKTIVLTVMK